MEFSVTAEEIVTTYEDPNNGSGPMWCYGSPTIARDGQRVFVAIPEVGKDVQPLCNTRWQLFCRHDGRAWERVQVSPKFDEREPCPLLRLPGGRLVLSVNPSTGLRGRMDDGRLSHYCRPQLLEFRSDAATEPPEAAIPRWDKEYEFTEHSYRAAAANGKTGEILLLNIHGYNGQAWSYRTAQGEWLRQGYLKFPLRGCYPQAAIGNRAAHIMAVSDIVEPNLKWREYKREFTGQPWDYDFRQLYFTFTPDITREDFWPILTIASRDETCGLIRNLDLWVDSEGAAHLLYLDRTIWHTFMRDHFFPEIPIEVSLRYAQVRDGKVVDRKTIWRSEEDRLAARPEIRSGEGRTSTMSFASKTLAPVYAAFHEIADGRLLILFAVADPHPSGGGVTEMYILPVYPSAAEKPERLDLKHPLSQFFTAAKRLGTDPSDTIDLYGMGPEPRTLRYAQVRVV